MKRNTLGKRTTMSHLKHVGHRSQPGHRAPILTKRHNLPFGGIPHANLCHKTVTSVRFEVFQILSPDTPRRLVGGSVSVIEPSYHFQKLETTRYLELE